MVVPDNVCAICGRPYVQRTNNQKYCSQLCRKRAELNRYRELRNIKKRPDRDPSIVYGKDGKKRIEYCLKCPFPECRNCFDNICLKETVKGIV